jgi:Tol biopolymer transport system component
MDANGANAKKIIDRASEPTWSPDGTKIAYYHWKDGIFVANADGSNPQKVVGDTQVGYLDWSHDGRWIAFAALPGGQGNIVVNVVPPDGSALKDPGARHYISVGSSPAWSPDDTLFAIDSCDTANHCGIFKVASGGGGSIVPVVTDGGGAPVWSPNGKQIVYQADIDGQKQLVIIGADGSGKTQLTHGPSMHVDAGWSADGNFIFYRSPEAGSWGIWRMNPDGSNPVKLIDNVAPVDFAHERLAVSR